MAEYNIPLSSIYNEGEGNRVLIDGRKVSLAGRFGDTPHDVITLHSGEVEELIHVLTAYLARDNDGTLGRSPTGCRFEEYRTDTGGDGSA